MAFAACRRDGRGRPATCRTYCHTRARRATRQGRRNRDEWSPHRNPARTNSSRTHCRPCGLARRLCHGRDEHASRCRRACPTTAIGGIRRYHQELHSSAGLRAGPRLPTESTADAHALRRDRLRTIQRLVDGTHKPALWGALRLFRRRDRVVRRHRRSRRTGCTIRREARGQRTVSDDHTGRRDHDARLVARTPLRRRRPHRTCAGDPPARLRCPGDARHEPESDIRTPRRRAFTHHLGVHDRILRRRGARLRCGLGRCQ
ncbi:Uncharacterised protein [Mycobacteroides abscessus subsp. abscessus]|nr:Uncharacterised protein [Mycobacteroides abscessus subsp. abscessus]